MCGPDAHRVFEEMALRRDALLKDDPTVEGVRDCTNARPHRGQGTSLWREVTSESDAVEVASTCYRLLSIFLETLTRRLRVVIVIF